MNLKFFGLQNGRKILKDAMLQLLTDVDVSNLTNRGLIRYDESTSKFVAIEEGQILPKVSSALLTPPVTPTEGMRILISDLSGSVGTATGDFAGHENQIAVYDGTAWTFIPAANADTFTSVDAINSMVMFDGTVWRKVAATDATEIPFDNSGTDLTATTVQDAITELLGNLDTLDDAFSTHIIDASVHKTSADVLSLINGRAGVIGGFAPLDSNNRIPSEYIPLEFVRILGTWDASTNTPTLTDGDPLAVQGDAYRVVADGTQTFNGVEYDFHEGDWVVYAAGGFWFKASNGEVVTSVNGKRGDIDLTQSYYSIGQIDASMSLKIDVAEKGAASGVATLGLDVKLPRAQATDGALVFKGNYDASTNTPDITTTPVKGDVYDVTAEGTLNSGALEVEIGDRIFFNGTEFEKLSSLNSNSISITNQDLTATNVADAIDEIVAAVGAISTQNFPREFVAGEAIAQYDIVAMLGTNGDGKVYKGRALDTDNYKVVGIATNAAAAGENVNVIYAGIYQDAGLTTAYSLDSTKVAKTLYLSTTVDGGIVFDLAPVTGDVIAVIGIVLGTDMILIRPESPIIVE